MAASPSSLCCHAPHMTPEELAFPYLLRSKTQKSGRPMRHCERGEAIQNGGQEVAIDWIGSSLCSSQFPAGSTESTRSRDLTLAESYRLRFAQSRDLFRLEA